MEEDDPHEHNEIETVDEFSILGMDRDRLFAIYGTKRGLEDEETKKVIGEYVDWIAKSDDVVLKSAGVLILGEYSRSTENGHSNFKLEVYSKAIPRHIAKSKEIYEIIKRNAGNDFEGAYAVPPMPECAENEKRWLKIGEIKCRKKLLIYEVADFEAGKIIAGNILLKLYSSDYSDAGPIIRIKEKL